MLSQALMCPSHRRCLRPLLDTEPTGLRLPDRSLKRIQALLRISYLLREYGWWFSGERTIAGGAEPVKRELSTIYCKSAMCWGGALNSIIGRR